MTLAVEVKGLDRVRMVARGNRSKLGMIAASLRRFGEEEEGI